MSTRLSDTTPPLTPRQEDVLRAVVERHIASGQPVGSKHIAGHGDLDWASSTLQAEFGKAAVDASDHCKFPFKINMLR